MARRKIVIDVKKELEKIDFKNLTIREEKTHWRRLTIINNGNSKFKDKEVTSITFNTESRGIFITMSNIKAGGYYGNNPFSFLIGEWDRNKVLANLLCAMQVLSQNPDATTGFAVYKWGRQSNKVQVLDRARRNKMVRALANSGNLSVPEYMEDLLKRLEHIITNKALKTKGGLKSEVRDVFKVLMKYECDEEDVLRLWREIVAEEVVSS